jgi:hypothetical protein
VAFGTVNVRLRPIKLAFLVDPADKAALLEAIEINTFLWGGMFNPIIPTFDRTPIVWRRGPPRESRSKKILTGYLDAYDPDYVVPLGKWAGRTLNVGNRRTVSSSEVLTGVEEEGNPQYGIGLFEMLQRFVAEELKFVRREPLDVRLPDWGREFRHFLGSIFGFLSEKVDRMFQSNFQRVLGAKKYPCSRNNYLEFLTPGNLFLRRLSSLYLTWFPTRSPFRGPCIFFCDAGKPLDTIDYWNLRAIGWKVIPVPRQSAQLDGVKKFASDFIEHNFFPDHFNPRIYHNTILLKSRSVSEEELEQFGASLSVSPSGTPGEPKFVYQHWYPRIWSEWARDMDHVECCELESDATELDVSESQKTIRFRTLDPKFISESVTHSGPRFANEIELRLYGSDEPLAEIFPVGGEEAAGPWRFFGFGEWRYSRKGVCHLSHLPGGSVELSLPLAEDVFSKWLRSRKKWEVTLSPAGRVAKQMLRLLGGKHSVSTLADEGIIRLLGSAEERETTTKEGKVVVQDAKAISKEKLCAEVSKIAQQGRFPINPQRILQRLTDAKMFQLGLQLQCPVCGKHPWYSVKDIDYELECHDCGGRFSIPSHSPDEIKWSYRPFGPFRSPNRAYGVYTVLLTLRFFSELLQGVTTPIMSFTAEPGGKEMADLGLFFRKSKFGYGKTETIFAECKTHMPFRKSDVDRMKALYAGFPGALLVFATLNKELSSNEKRLLSMFVQRSRRDWLADRPFSPVLILTGIELYSDEGPPQCWKALPGKHSAFAGYHRVRADLLELCDVTLQVHLGLPSRHEWLDEQRRKRRKRNPQSASP